MARVDKIGSVAGRARRVVPRRCAAAADRMAGLDRKVIRRRVPATSGGRHFAEAAAGQAALHL